MPKKNLVFCTVASPAARLSPAALPPHQREQEQQHWWALRSFFDQKPKGEYPLPMFLSTREQHQPFANGGDGQPDFAALFQYLNKRNLHSSAVSPDIGGTSMGYEEMVDGGQRDIRSPLGTMVNIRFEYSILKIRHSAFWKAWKSPWDNALWQMSVDGGN
jgi:hypothetical protein